MGGYGLGWGEAHGVGGAGPETPKAGGRESPGVGFSAPTPPWPGVLGHQAGVIFMLGPRAQAAGGASTALAGMGSGPRPLPVDGGTGLWAGLVGR